MRRLLLAVVALMVGVVMAVPAGAQDNTVEIAVPDYIPVNGTLDIVVRTGGSSDVVHSENCMGGGDFLRSPVVILDQSQRVAGRYTGILISHDIHEGTRITDMVFTRYCYEPDGTVYKMYIGTVSG